MNEKQFLIEMGQRVAARRKELGLTQEQTAERMNVSLQTVSCVELGKKAIRPENLAKLCQVLDTSADHLLYGRIPTDQLQRSAKKLAALQEDEFRMVDELIDFFLRKSGSKS